MRGSGKWREKIRNMGKYLNKIVIMIDKISVGTVIKKNGEGD